VRGYYGRKPRIPTRIKGLWGIRGFRLCRLAHEVDRALVSHDTPTYLFRDLGNEGVS
jgi:hypothetical protein